MKSITTYSKKKYSVIINTWYLNPISVARAYNLPDDQCFPLDIGKFNYEYEKEHGLLNINKNKEVKFMKNIKTFSNRKFSLSFSKWELNAISFTRACNIPHEACKPLDSNKFFYEFEKKHGLLNIVAEESENYFYS